jgi:hypothetical protein
MSNKKKDFYVQTELEFYSNSSTDSSPKKQDDIDCFLSNKKHSK